MSDKKYLTKDEIEKVCGVKVATLEKYISDFEFQPEEVITNSRRQKQFESLAIIRLFESKGKISEGEKLYNYLTNSYDIVGCRTIEKLPLALPAPNNLVQKLLDSNSELIDILRNSSEANTRSHQTFQFFLKTQEDLRTVNQSLYEQNKSLLNQVGKLLLLEEKRQEQLELQNSQKKESVETSQPAFSFLGFTISRTQSSRPQIA